VDGRAGPYAWRHNALAYGEGIAQAAGKEDGDGMNNEDKEDDDLKDTGTSPIKTNQMEVDIPQKSGDSGAKRSLDLALLAQNMANDNAEEGDGVHPVNAAGLTDQGVIDITENAENDRNKRSKKDGAISPSTGSADSLEVPVRSQ
jgi:hypothetical protein